MTNAFEIFKDYLQYLNTVEFGREVAEGFDVQMNIISKKYEFKTYGDDHPKWGDYNYIVSGSDPEEISIEDSFVPCIVFKDVVVKYRPHLKMGDYALFIYRDGGALQYYFTQTLDCGNDKFLLTGQHPHISGGRPCLGQFQATLDKAWHDQNYVVFFALVKKYLEAYNGRSTYLAGKYYKTQKFQYIIVPHEERDGVDENTNWGLPNNLEPTGFIEVDGLSNMAMFMRKGSSENELLKVVYELIGNQAKVLGYAVMIKEMLNISLNEALISLARAAMHLKASMMGCSEEERIVIDEIFRKMASDIGYPFGTRDVKFRVHTPGFTYNYPLSNEQAKEYKVYHEILSKTLNEKSYNYIMSRLPYANAGIPKIIVKIMKSQYEKLKWSTFEKEETNIDLKRTGEKAVKLYNKLKYDAYSETIKEVDNIKRRLVNGLPKGFTPRTIIETGQQSELFTDEISE